MKCPKCKELAMKVDVDEQKYVCSNCKYEIKWMKEREGEITNGIY